MVTSLLSVFLTEQTPPLRICTCFCSPSVFFELLTLRDGPLDDGEVGREALLGDGAVGVDCQGQNARVGDDSARGVLPAVPADVRANCGENREQKE